MPELKTKAEDMAFPAQEIDTDAAMDEVYGQYSRTYSHDQSNGLTKIEYIATHIFQGISSSERISGMSVEEVADLAYEGAVALIQRLNRT